MIWSLIFIINYLIIGILMAYMLSQIKEHPFKCISPKRIRNILTILLWPLSCGFIFVISIKDYVKHLLKETND